MHKSLSEFLNWIFGSTRKKDSISEGDLICQAIEELCTFPTKIVQDSTVSAFKKLIVAKYQLDIDQSEIQKYLKVKSNLVQLWENYSENELHCGSGLYLARPGHFVWNAEDAYDDKSYKWRVGEISHGYKKHEIVFDNKYTACAYFIHSYTNKLKQIS